MTIPDDKALRAMLATFGDLSAPERAVSAAAGELYGLSVPLAREVLALRAERDALVAAGAAYLAAQDAEKHARATLWAANTSWKAAGYLMTGPMVDAFKAANRLDNVVAAKHEAQRLFAALVGYTPAEPQGPAPKVVARARRVDAGNGGEP